MVDLKICIPKGYIRDEIICDHLVTKKTKEIWAVEIDLIEELKRVCKKYNLIFCADSGTLLGAVRHKGFIPWDDDIDVAMPREDYEKLLQIANNEFKHPYFFDSFETSNVPQSFAKLRNSKTTAIENIESDRNQGIFIDIFPVDHLIEDKKLLERQRKIISLWDHLFLGLWICVDETYNLGKESMMFNISIKIAKFFTKLFGLNQHSKIFSLIMKKRLKAVTLYNRRNTKYSKNLAGLGKSGNRHTTEDFNHLNWVDFEFIKMPIELHYDENLKAQFGDYHKFVKGASMHQIITFDTNRSYVEVLKELRNQSPL